MNLSRPLVAAVSVFACCAALAPGQPLGDTTGQPPIGQPAGTGASDDDAPSGWFPLPKVALPKITMPKVEMPKIEMSKMASTAMAPIKVSAQKIGDGSKKAWEGTKELFRFGQPADAPAARVASRPQPSMWQRMFGGAPEENPGPQTIGEFMAGTRPE